MTEMLDVYDANRHHIGIADRDVVHSVGLWHKTVHCWVGIAEPSGKNMLVFQRRVSPGSYNDGKLYTTASGHVSAGETLEQAFSREIGQEIGINLTKESDCKGIKFINETVWIKDMKRKDDSIMRDRVFANIYCTMFERKTGSLGDDLNFWKKFLFNDGEVSGLVAIYVDEFIGLCEDLRKDIQGIEWDGKNLHKITLTPGNFVLNDGETLDGKYRFIAEFINKGIN